MKPASAQARRVALMVVAVALVVACGDDTGSTTTTADGSGVELGSGEVPGTVPAVFPIPDTASVGATLVNGDTGETEMILRFPTELPVAVRYYEQNLDARGYSVDSSDALADGTWSMTFRKNALDGSIALRPEGDGLSSLVVRLSS